MFDRREILLPVVPLGATAKCIFRIYNDGYESINLKWRILEELVNLDIKCNFIDG
jgi:hypothetical protein